MTEEGHNSFLILSGFQFIWLFYASLVIYEDLEIKANGIKHFRMTLFHSCFIMTATKGSGIKSLPSDTRSKDF